MNEAIKGTKAILLSVLVLSATYFLLLNNPQAWQSSIPTLNTSLMFAVLLTVIINIYFKRTRLVFITLFWGALYYYQTTLLDYAFVDSQIIFIAGLLLHLLMSNIQERSLISLHFSRYMLLIVATLCVPFAWQTAVDFLVTQVPSYPQISYLYIELPIILVAINFVYKSTHRMCLSQIATTISFIIWIFYSYQLIDLPLILVLTMVISYNLVLLILDTYRLAFFDELTRLPSRRALEQDALSLGSTYCIAMLDIDHFKKFNDTHGHDVGDQVLKLVASKLAKVKRGGKVFRYGGEEFTIVFPRKSTAQISAELERIRSLVGDYKIVIRKSQRQSKEARSKGSNKYINKTVKVTISIGVCDHQGKESFQQTMTNADKALYQAKSAGRNRVICS